MFESLFMQLGTAWSTVILALSLTPIAGLALWDFATQLAAASRASVGRTTPRWQSARTPAHRLCRRRR